MATQPSDRLPPAPRPRTSLRNAMRQQGIDEHKIAFCINEQVDRLRGVATESENEKKPAAEEKMILDVLKECVKIIDPAARAGAAAEAPAFVLSHQVPRPNRDETASNGHSNGRPDDASIDIEQ